LQRSSFIILRSSFLFMEAYFRTTSYALVVTAFLAVALTGTLDTVSIVLYSIAVVVCFYRDARGVTRLRLREWMWRALSIAYVPFVFVDGALISNRVLALVHMTLFVSAANLFQNKRDRDWVFLYLIAFFQMLLAAGLTFNATFVASLATFLFFFISTLAAFEIRRARREVGHMEEEIVTPLKQPQHIKYRAQEEPGRARGSGRVRYLLGASVTQSIIVAALTLPFFFLIPRLGGGGVARGFGEGDAITGFSDRVELGQFASIKKSTRVVMRVHLDHKPPRYLRWRGVALENYDGRAWNVVKEDLREELDNQGVSFSGDATAKDTPFTYKHGLRVRPSSHPVLLEQKFFLEPIETLTLFAAQRALSVQGPMASLSRDKHTGALSAIGLKGRTAYTVSSDVSVPSEQDLRADSPASSPEDVKRLDLPPLRKLDPRISQLAHEITRNSPTPYDKAKAIENYLKTEFRYTLELKGVEGDPLAEFLFQTREGHCEYFATAMAIMLRTLDIPARIVNGFQMGEYNDLNDMYTVRESDAHSWVEAYFPRSESWVEFDPTPSAGINDYTRGGLLASLRRYADAMEVFWLDYIVTLDSDEQASIMVDLQHRLLKVRDRLLVYYLGVKLWARDVLNKLIINRQWGISDLLKLATALAVLGLSLVSLYVIISYRKRRGLPPTGYGPWWHRLFVLPMWRRRSARRDYRQSAVLFYEQMLAIARRAGLVKQPYQTPVEFAAASGLSPIREITTLYNRVRFGGAQLDEGETRRVSALLGELKQSIRRR
jgi:transglutaminase-like putative cysteine protease